MAKASDELWNQASSFEVRNTLGEVSPAQPSRGPPLGLSRPGGGPSMSVRASLKFSSPLQVPAIEVQYALGKDIPSLRRPSKGPPPEFPSQPVAGLLCWRDDVSVVGASQAFSSSPWNLHPSSKFWVCLVPSPSSYWKEARQAA